MRKLSMLAALSMGAAMMSLNKTALLTHQAHKPIPTHWRWNWSKLNRSRKWPHAESYQQARDLSPSDEPVR